MTGANAHADDWAERLEARYRPMLESSPSTTARYQAHLNLGLLACRGTDMAEARAHLEAAAAAGIDDLSERAARGAVTNDPIALELPLMLTAAFGDERVRQAAADLPREPWFGESQWHPDLQVLAAALDALRNLSARRPLAAVRLTEIAAAARSLHSDDRPYPWIGALVVGLAALKAADPMALEASIDSLLRLHEREAKAGSWQRLPEGLLALWPLALYRLARERGLNPAVDSPYLPPGLVG
ncbi:MAG: Immunity protein 49 [Chromatiaceae bacterium]|nr:Immunity protein 49 [Chromatiaceae bacterium]